MSEDIKKDKAKLEREKALNFVGLNQDEFSEVSRRCSGKILGIDYGTKNIGLALSDREQRQAFVYDTLKATGKLFINIAEICEREEVDKIVVGLPLSMKGEYTKKTEEVMFFVGALEESTKVMVVTEDERLSSVQASKRSDGQGIDEGSAQIILQQYLDKLTEN
jgi:putative holliday junction resolvase